MQQHFIGVNYVDDMILDNMFSFGATLMFKYHYFTRELVKRYGFDSGEWFLLVCEAKDYKRIVKEVNEYFESLSEVLDIDWKIV